MIEYVKKGLPPTPQRWWRNTAPIPRLGFYEGRMAQVPVDFQHWIALLAPRTLFVAAALDDATFPNTQGMADLLRKARQAYRLHGVPASSRSWIFRGAHRFPRVARSRSYRLMETALVRNGAA